MRVSVTQDLKLSTGKTQPVTINTHFRTSTIQAAEKASKVSCPMSSKQKSTALSAIEAYRLYHCQRQTLLQSLGKNER